MKRNYIIFVLLLMTYNISKAQIKILFDATKAESAANADWVLDADTHNLYWTSSGSATTTGTESNPQRYPTPLQNTVTSTTLETYWDGCLSAWGIDMVKKGYEVETLPYNVAITYGNTSNVQDLSNYKVFIIDEPNVKFTVTEDSAIKKFVRNGGGLFIISDHDGSDRNNDGIDSPHVLNALMDTASSKPYPFGIRFDYVDISGTYSNVLNSSTDPLLHGVMGNVTKVQWSDGTTMTLEPADNSSVKGVAFKTGASTTGTTNCLVAYSTYGAGRVVAMSDSSPADDGSGDSGDQSLYNGWTQDASGNHEILIVNATIWLAGTTTSVPDVDESNSIIVNQLTYPNQIKFAVSSTENLTNSEFCVYDILGRQVARFTNPTSNDIVIKNDKIGKGIFIYKLIVNGKPMKTGKFAVL